MWLLDLFFGVCGLRELCLRGVFHKDAKIVQDLQSPLDSLLMARQLFRLSVISINKLRKSYFLKRVIYYLLSCFVVS